MVLPEHRIRPRQRRWLHIWVLLGLLIGGPLLTACGAASTASPPLKVVATLAPLADWARQVGRERVEVTQIVPAGIDPTSYTLTQHDRAVISNADVLLFNGYGLEPWIDQALEEIESPPLVTLELSQYVGVRVGGTHAIVRTPLEGEERGESGNKSQVERVYIPPSIASPYIWIDPTMAQQSVQLIADTLTRADRDNLLLYRRHADQYNGELENLDQWIRRQIRSWPLVKTGPKEILVMQGIDRSWHYFTQRYTINLRTAMTVNTFEPRIPLATPLFVNQFSGQPEPYLPEQRKPDGVLNPLADDSYIQLMKHNVNIMTQAMQRAAQNEPQQFKSQFTGH